MMMCTPAGVREFRRPAGAHLRRHSLPVVSLRETTGYLPERLRRLSRPPYSAVVQSTLPLLLSATSDRVGVPPDVVGGTITFRYVPPENGPIGSA